MPHMKRAASFAPIRYHAVVLVIACPFGAPSNLTHHLICFVASELHFGAAGAGGMFHCNANSNCPALTFLLRRVFAAFLA
jgi:hypothetical protein